MRKFFNETDPVVPVHHPRILVETAVEFGADRHALIENVGVSLEALGLPETRLSYTQFATLERNALRLTNNPGLGLYAGRNTQILSTGMVGIAAMNSPTGMGALDLALRYLHWLAPGWQIDVDVDRGVLFARETIPRGDLRVMACEWLSCALYTLGKQLLGQSPVRRMRMPFDEPAHSTIYPQFFDVPVDFGAPDMGSDLDMELLARHLKWADPAMSKLAEQYCATEASSGVVKGSVREQVRRVLKAKREGFPDLDEVARTLQTSGRSLRRELQKMQTTYQELLDEIRVERAEQLVLHTDLTIDRISEQLGFSDVRGFRRAFKRWTGQTPTELRTASRH